MVTDPDEVLRDMEDLFDACDHILEEDMPDRDVDRMQETAASLQERSEEYRKRLTDQERHSRSGLSREMASLLLSEDRKIGALIGKRFPAAEGAAGDPPDVNVGALYVEYLTGRAMQSAREALIGAMRLKILSRKTEAAAQAAGRAARSGNTREGEDHAEHHRSQL